ncbi:PEP/pyruvate-binding domain-containing protein [Actinoplanes sp. CA-142083]|uniref:PEP/pyruvate-binding domain-containing protein n=1 Tax=Actinoplanes sp. CA-142083 TaxID=3239903 RepID=UPI003D8F59E0
MSVIPLAQATSVAVAGGKASGLAELIRLGERVPPGFCVTTDAYQRGELPQAEILAAYEAMGAGPVAVRSSATAEDLPDASFAGQHDTVLDVTGGAELFAAIEKCWASLHSERAIAYRKARDIDPAIVRMAVVVQRMVDAAVAGVLFTANPVTGRRTEMVVDAAPGLGTAVVDGSAPVDHYELDDSEPSQRGCLSPDQLAELRATGERLQRELGAPQDVEWAIDHDGRLWLLQSRPITTLFPLPPPAGGQQPRVYLEFGNVQGMLQPVTPMGMSTLKKTVAAMAASIGLRVEITDIGGRLYGDLSDLARHPIARRRLVKLMAVDFGPRAQAVMEHVLADPRFAAQKGGSARRNAALANGPARGEAAPANGPARGEAAPANSPARKKASPVRTAARGVSGVLRALARPEAARERAAGAVERIRLASAPSGDLRTAADRLRYVQADGPADSGDDLTWPIVAGMLASALPAQLLGDVARPGEIHTVLGGMPHNVTIEMNLALWELATRAGEHRDLLLGTPPAELAARYLRGDLPDIGLDAFLDAYGHRGVAEADLGVPRWAEDPTPVLAVIANYLRLTDPDQAPGRRFDRAAEAAEAALADLTARARRRRPVRGRIAGFLLRRARALAGLREAGKFAGLYRLQAVRRELLLLGADLTATGVLTEPDDIMFLTLDEVATAVHKGADDAAGGAHEGADLRDIVAARRAEYRRESRRRAVPVALLSDGTDIEAVLPAASAPAAPAPAAVLPGVAGAPTAILSAATAPAALPPAAVVSEAASGRAVLRGVGASGGRATGPARVVRDPATAVVEPGDILVVATTDPGWTPLFLTAAALVTETGAVMAHGPTVAREYGIPAVIGVPGATARIVTGETITVDGAAGTVTLGS